MTEASRPYRSWTEPRQARLKTLWQANARVRDIARELNTSPGAIYVQANKLGLPPRRGPRSTAAAAPKRQSQQQDRTGQRRFIGVTPGTPPAVVLQPHHPAYRKATTFFPSQVKPASAMVRLLKSGEHSRKLGAMFSKGRWRGMPIVSLTLEERDTCPRSCLEWATCYGNNLHWSHRIHDDGTLTRRLWGELASLNAEHPNGFVVRLHVLGDFYSVEYVEFWRQVLADFPALHVFGFTARRAPDPIGLALAAVRSEHASRWMIRCSGADLEDMASEVVDQAEDATGIICPAELDPNRCCATCALCVQSLRTISFIRH